MRLFALLTMALLAAPLNADEFHFGKDRMIRGVLISETDGMLKIRVEGGEIEVPKTSVVMVVKDDLTVEAIKQQEDAKREQLERANQERRRDQAEFQEKMRQRRRAAAQRAALLRASRCHLYMPRYPRAYHYRYNPVMHNSRVTIREHTPGKGTTLRTVTIRPRW